jgi:hypothetical protein
MWPAFTNKKMKLPISSFGLLLGLLSGFSVVSTAYAQNTNHAQITVVPDPPHDISRAMQYKGLSAVISAPKDIWLHSSRSYPVSIQVFSLDGSPLPEKVTLRTYGLIQSGKSSALDVLDIELENGRASAVVSFTTIVPRGKKPLGIEVTSIDNPHGYLGRSEVLVRSPDSFKTIDKYPRQLPADGTSTTDLWVEIKDEQGDPVAGMPFLVRYHNPGSRRYAKVVWTDSKGRATFTTPAISHEGPASFQFVSDTVVSSQFIITYVNTDLKLTP